MLGHAVFWDSSASLALVDAGDDRHGLAIEIFHKLSAELRPGVITNDIEVETHALLLSRLGRGVALDWLLHHGLAVLRITPEEEQAARNLLVKHSDKSWSYAMPSPSP